MTAETETKARLAGYANPVPKRRAANAELRSSEAAAGRQADPQVHEPDVAVKSAMLTY